ncbi:AAA domain-containing protein [Acinetobacter baumannii]|uniref:AAA domain-containing protein n=1 Tax=Acinetobacter baumannii TaxID=470 RepID=UPI0025DE725C|nr:AAA domain-containing protein [Acinetobacter baumannii]MDV4307964.1 AAA domain-containing protein [Acinetobacter baumannii]
MNLLNSNFLKNFDAIEILDEGNHFEGKPTLIYAEYRGNPKFIKFWQKLNSSPELEHLWLQEIRELQRLKGYPNPESHIAYLDQSGKDDLGFYLVLETTGRLPLSYSKQRWLKAIKDLNSNKLTFWTNIIRIVRAVDFLHSQGILHRNLDKDAILIGDEVHNNNFQLTGFEWSIRIQNFASNISRQQASCKNIKNHLPQIYSFSSDWYALGLVIVELLNTDVSDINDIGISSTIVAQKTKLSVREISLIRALLGLTKIRASIPSESLNGELIEEYIEKNILHYLDESESLPYDLIFAFPKFPEDTEAGLRQRVGLRTAVNEKYEEKFSIYTDDESDLFKFVCQDLSENPVLLSFIYGGKPALLLKGTELIYLLEPNKPSRNSEKTWDAAYCQAAFREMPEVLKNNDFLFLDTKQLKFWSNRQSQNFSFRSWENLLAKVNTGLDGKTEKQKEIVDSFIICHLTEMAYARSEIYPVNILNIQDDADEPDCIIVKIFSSLHPPLEDLSQALGIDAPAKRLKKAFDNEELELDWVLTSKDNFQEDDESIELSYVESQLNDGKDIYIFRSRRNLQSQKGNFYIMPSSVEGTIRQLSRRAKALDLLNKHTPLIENLLEPHRLQHSPESHQIKDVDKHLESLKISLDNSKKEAFKNILYTLPTYLIQGPPGVGKTYLVTALVQHIFSQESEARVLLTAQSHSTVQHLYHEVIQALPERSGLDNPLLIVKCIRTSDSDDIDTNSDLDRQVIDFLKNLTQSKLFINSKRSDIKANILTSLKPDERGHRYSLMNHLLRSANMVFTTTNSKYVENMLTHKAQFDWSIMEETGKVSGIELLSPMLLSHRRLMIGDHLQLPPYRTAEIQSIFKDPQRLYKAIQTALDGKKVVGKGDSINSRIQSLRKIPSDKTIEWQKIGSYAAKTHLLFKMFINNEEAKANAAESFGNLSQYKPIASMLAEQYRMHPSIADIISSVFYNVDAGKASQKLVTNKETKAKFEKENPPFYWLDTSKLNNSPPLVWIDIPDVMQKQKTSKYADKPTWYNNVERDIIITILESLRGQVGVSPKLAILSAYKQQIKQIETQIKFRQNKSLNHLNDFSKPDDHQSFCSTINSFQGAEADIVIISMVRNNISPTVRSAFGFFIDAQLLNVMLSRARYQMIIVGSFDFLKRWANKSDVLNNPDFKFLAELVNKLIELENAQKLLRIPSSNFLS